MSSPQGRSREDRSQAHALTPHAASMLGVTLTRPPMSEPIPCCLVTSFSGMSSPCTIQAAMRGPARSPPGLSAWFRSDGPPGSSFTDDQ